jgi:hypothetical protein
MCELCLNIGDCTERTSGFKLVRTHTYCDVATKPEDGQLHEDTLSSQSGTGENVTTNSMQDYKSRTWEDIWILALKKDLAFYETPVSMPSSQVPAIDALFVPNDFSSSFLWETKVSHSYKAMVKIVIFRFYDENYNFTCCLVWHLEM